MQADTEAPSCTGEATATAGLRSLYAIAGGGALVNVFRSVHDYPATGTLWMDPYWVNFYLTRYGDGYRRRALMGSVLSHLFRGGISIVALNVLAACVMLVAFVLLFGALSQLTRRHDSAWARVFLFALAASTLTAVFYETMGDLLQVCLVLACGSAMVAARYLRSEPLRLLAGLAMVGVCFLFHEASLFLVAPALAFLVKARPKPRDFVVPLGAMALLLLVSLHWSERFPAPTYPTLLLNHTRLVAGLGAAPALRWNLVAEYRAYFGTPAARLYFAGRFPRILALIFAYMLALVNCLPRRAGRRTLYAFAIITVLSLPLWVIAVDWGRFLSYAFWLAVVSTGVWQDGDLLPTSQKRDVGHREMELPEDAAPRALDVVWGWLEALNRRDLLRLGAVFVLLTGPEWAASHIDGTPLLDSLAFCAVAVLAMLVPGRAANEA